MPMPAPHAKEAPPTNESLEHLRDAVYRLARNPAVTFEQLEPFTRHPDKELRAILALNTRDPRILEILSKDKEWAVREEVSMNHCRTPAITERLRTDENPSVRYHIKNSA
ncbi:MAG: hypothetical protein LVQ95_04105 [Candidatus Micrarchaeales archaeon]|nr:hypothetical protein [Candidatus Micrarchaeales archaeon]